MQSKSYKLAYFILVSIAILILPLFNGLMSHIENENLKLATIELAGILYLVSLILSVMNLVKKVSGLKIISIVLIVVVCLVAAGAIAAYVITGAIHGR